MKGERIWGICCNGVFLCGISDRKYDHAQSISGVENMSPELSPLPEAGWKKCLFSLKGCGGFSVITLGQDLLYSSYTCVVGETG